jgi:hypothetical protein
MNEDRLYAAMAVAAVVFQMWVLLGCIAFNMH